MDAFDFLYEFIGAFKGTGWVRVFTKKGRDEARLKAEDKIPPGSRIIGYFPVY